MVYTQYSVCVYAVSLISFPGWVHIQVVCLLLWCTLTFTITGYNVFIVFSRESIHKLWQNLNGSDPEIINDFEEFISGISAEVQVAQNALS